MNKCDVKRLYEYKDEWFILIHNTPPSYIFFSNSMEKVDMNESNTHQIKQQNRKTIFLTSVNHFAQFFRGRNLFLELLVRWKLRLNFLRKIL